MFGIFEHMPFVLSTLSGPTYLHLCMDCRIFSPYEISVFKTLVEFDHFYQNTNHRSAKKQDFSKMFLCIVLMRISFDNLRCSFSFISDHQQATKYPDWNYCNYKACIFIKCGREIAVWWCEIIVKCWLNLYPITNQSRICISCMVEWGWIYIYFL